MDRLLSVVVPVYNAEKYLHKCIDSILEASDSESEIILVNDGSKDRSGEICDEYAEKDSRIRVIHQENKGVTPARREGVRVASGRYLNFVDSDDWIDKDMYKIMLEKAVVTKSDVVICNIMRENKDGRYLTKNHVPEGLYEKEKLEKEFYPSMLFDFHTFGPGVDPSLCNKIIKKEILEKIICDIDETITYGEDALCSYPSMVEAEKIYVIDDVGFYHYRQNFSSITNVYDSKLLGKCRILFEEIRRQFTEKNFDDNGQVSGYSARLSLIAMRGELLYSKDSLKKRIRRVKEYIENDRIFSAFGVTINRIEDKKEKTKIHLVRKKRIFLLYLLFWVKEFMLKMKRKRV